MTYVKENYSLLTRNQYPKLLRNDLVKRKPFKNLCNRCSRMIKKNVKTYVIIK